MAVSVRMDSLWEQDLERAAKRQGITKSQFIVNAVEQALGRKDSYQLLLQAQEAYGVRDAPAQDPLQAWGELRSAGLAGSLAPAVSYRDALRAKHEASMKDWLAYHAARDRGEEWVPDDERAPEDAAPTPAASAPAAAPVAKLGKATLAKPRGALGKEVRTVARKGLNNRAGGAA
jgi:predicted DNA-binding protein